MTIGEVCAAYGVTPDTLRYYERAGVIPRVTRTPAGIRDYREEDLRWVEKAVCMRDAGVPIELLVRYIQLCRDDRDTLREREEILKQTRARIVEARNKCDAALARLDEKIAAMETAIATGTPAEF